MPVLKYGGGIDVFYILLGDDPMLYGSIEQNK
jgi:hypothetical protein